MTGLESASQAGGAVPRIYLHLCAPPLLMSPLLIWLQMCLPPETLREDTTLWLESSPMYRSAAAPHVHHLFVIRLFLRK